MELDLHNILENAEESEILTIITMSLYYYTNKYNKSYNEAIKLIKGGYKQLQKIKEV